MTLEEVLRTTPGGQPMSDMRRSTEQIAQWPHRWKPLSFGAAILKARTDMQLLQKDVAAAIVKQDGVAMSASYLNDIERDRRNPPNAHIIRQLASTLDLDEDYLWFLAGRIPTDMLELTLDQASISRAVKTLRRTLLVLQRLFQSATDVSWNQSGTERSDSSVVHT